MSVKGTDRPQLYLVEKFCGREVALQCAKSLLVGTPRSRQSGYSAVPLSRPHSGDRIRKAEEYPRKHSGGDVSIDALADRFGTGPRNFVRFNAASGRMPAAGRLYPDAADVGGAGNDRARRTDERSPAQNDAAETA